MPIGTYLARANNVRAMNFFTDSLLSVLPDLGLSEGVSTDMETAAFAGPSGKDQSTSLISMNVEVQAGPSQGILVAL